MKGIHLYAAASFALLLFLELFACALVVLAQGGA